MFSNPYWEKDPDLTNCKLIEQTASTVNTRLNSSSINNINWTRIFRYLATGSTADGQISTGSYSQLYRFTDGYRQYGNVIRYIDPENNVSFVGGNGVHSNYNNRIFVDDNVDFTDASTYYADGVYICNNWRNISYNYPDSYSQNPNGNGFAYILGRFFWINEQNVYSWWMILKGSVTNYEIPDYPNVMTWQGGTWTYVDHGFNTNGNAQEDWETNQA